MYALGVGSGTGCSSGGLSKSTSWYWNFFCATFADGGLSDLGAPESRLDDPPLGISLIVTIGGTRG